MTKQEKKLIDAYSDRIITAGKANYTRNVPKYVLEQLLDIYNRELGTKAYWNFNCSVCILDFLKKFYTNIYSKMYERNT